MDDHLSLNEGASLLPRSEPESQKPLSPIGAYSWWRRPGSEQRQGQTYYWLETEMDNYRIKKDKR